jgi:phosphogluconate dehydratase
MKSKVIEVTERIIQRSKASRSLYLNQMQAAFDKGINRRHLSCGNLAHGFAGCNAIDKEHLSGDITPNLGIITAYNDMLSAHKPYEDYPPMIRAIANKYNAVAQVAGGTPAMCDGVTQGQKGMELSLLSRDVIALGASVGLSHNMFDAAIFLGICDKIVPGLMMSALRFGHLPIAFLPGGPMTSGISNEEKARIRQEYAEGKITRAELLKGESDSYHSPGTCTFYGTANSNQMLMEIMGVHLPGASFVNPGTKMREALNDFAIKTLIDNVHTHSFDCTMAAIISEKTIVNGIVGLLATGGSTNLTIHMLAFARAAGIIINWDDFSDLSAVVPLITRVYPNGSADVNHFHAAGGMSFVIKTLLDEGVLHDDVQTVLGHGLNAYTKEPKLKNDQIVYEAGAAESLNENVLRPASNPFSHTGGIVLMKGNIGRAVLKVSAVKDEDRIIKAPAIVFNEQEDLKTAFKNDELKEDFVAVFPFQGPKHNGMPELHQLMPVLSILQKRGLKVGLITDGRMSGASGKVASAIHVTPEAKDGGPIAKIRTGDIIEINCDTGAFNVLNEAFLEREPSTNSDFTQGLGTELFSMLRSNLSNSEEGASFILS